MGIKRILTLPFLFFFFINATEAQPVWSSGPTAVPGIMTVDVTFTLDQNSKVYFIAYPYPYATAWTSAEVKNLATVSGVGICYRTTLNYSTPGVPATITAINFPPNSSVSIYLVAESNPGSVLQLVPIKLTPKTIPCPKIDILYGLSQPVTCINKGAEATFNMFIFDPTKSGILKGTKWAFNWGDGTTSSFISPEDNILPDIALRTHTYSSASSCNYLFSCNITNPCGETKVIQIVAVVHGRDINTDGDGILRIVDNATSSTTVQVCEGAQTTVIIRDNSTWNCQSPAIPGFMTIPNTDPRNVEWLYGRDPSGTVINNITGAVLIGGGLGNAPQTSGRISPSPYGPSSLSQTIIIPATCKPGESMRVYLKNWNKCNWADPEYISTFIDIQVIPAPPAPVVPSKGICVGGDRTLTATSVPIGKIEWFSDALLTTKVGEGISYIPVPSGVGSYDYYVTDKSLTGLGCRSVATKTTLTIMPIPPTPVITPSGTYKVGKVDGSLVICYDPPVNYITLTASATGTSYKWYQNGVFTGKTTPSITLMNPSEQGLYTVTAVGPGPSFCESPPSGAYSTLIYAVSDLAQPSPATVCEGTNAYFASSSMDASIQRWQWQVSTDNGASFSNCGNGTLYSGFNTNSLTVVNAPYSINGYVYRVYIDTHHAQGDCRFFSNAVLLTVNKKPIVNPGAILPAICQGGITAPLGGSVTGTFTTTTWSTPAGGTFTPNANTLNATWTPPGSYSGTAVLTLTADGGVCGLTMASKTQVVYPTANITTQPADRAVCIGNTTTFSVADDGIAPVISRQWKVSSAGIGGPYVNVTNGGIYSGATTTTLTLTNVTALYNNYYYQCVITTTGPCPITSTSGKLSINPNPVITMAVSDQTICSGNTATINVSNTVIGTSYQLRNGITNIGAPQDGNGGILTFNASPEVTTSYNVLATIVVTGCALEVTDKAMITVNPSPTPVISGNSGPCEGINANYSVIPLAGHTYSWTLDPLGVIVGSSTGSSVVVLWSSAGTGWVEITETIPATGCFTPIRKDVVINPGPPVVAPVVTGPDWTCKAQTGVIYTVVPLPDASWYEWSVPVGAIIVSGQGTTSITVDFPGVTPGLGKIISCIPRNGCGDGPGGIKTVDISDVLLANISGGLTPICYNTNPGLLTATGIGGPPAAYTYLWYKDGVTTGVVTKDYDPGALTASASFYCAVNSVFTCGPVNTPTINIVVPGPLTAAIGGGLSPICYNTNPGILTATGSGGKGPGTYTYEWFKNGATTGILTQTYDPGLLTATSSYYCEITSADCGTVSTPVTTITVPGILAASISGGMSPICYFSNPGLLTADASGGNGFYTYLWYKNAVSTGITTKTFDPGNLTATATYTCAVTSGLCGTVTTTPVTITVPGVLAATITGGNTPICYNAPGGTFTVSASGGTGAYSYMWYINGMPTGSTGLSYSPGPLTVTSVIYCAVTSGTCGTVNTTATTITVFGDLTADISGGTSPVCYDNNPGVMSATGGGGTGTYTYLWYKNGGSTGVTTQTYDPGNLTVSSTFYCAITSGSCGTVNTPLTTIVVYNDLAANISGGTSTICYNTSPGVMTAVPMGGTGTYSYEWFRDGVTTGITFQTYDPGNLTAASTEFYCKITSGICGFVTTPPFTVTVPGILTAAIAGGTPEVCYNTNPGMLTATGGGGINIYSYLWYKNGISTGIMTANYDPGMLTSTSSYYCAITSGTCGTVNSTPVMTITVNPNPVVTITNPAAVCSPATVDLTQPAVTAGSTAMLTYTYWTNALATIPYPTFTAATTGTYYIKGTTAAGCYDIKPVTVVVNSSPTVIVTNPAAVCSPGTVDITQPAVSAGSTAGLTFTYWMDATATTPYFLPTMATNGTYYIKGITAQGCYDIKPVIVTVNPTPVLTSTATPPAICSGTAFNYIYTGTPAGATFAWIRASVPGITEGPNSGTGNINEVLTNTTTAPVNVTYIYTGTAGACTSVKNVIVTVNPSTGATAFTSGAVTLCQDAADETYTATATASTSMAYSVAPLAAGTINAVSGVMNWDPAFTGVATITATATGLCGNTSATRLVTVNPKAAITAMSATICSGGTFTLTPANGINGAVPAGTTYSWSSPAGAGFTGGASGSGSPNISGTLINTTSAVRSATYTITPLTGSCTGTNFTVTITINPAAAIAAMATTICSGGTFSVAPADGINGTVPVGTVYSWPMPVVTGGLTGASASAGTPALISSTLSNPTNVPQIAFYTVTPLSGSCTGPAFTVTVTVNPAPVINTMNAIICSGESFTLIPANVTDGIVPAGTTYSWAAPTGSGFAGGAPGSGASIGGTLTNTTSAIQTATYTVTPVSGACTGTAFTVNVTIKPKPAVTAMSATISSGGTFTLTPADVTNGAVPAGTIYSWAAPAGAGFTGGASGSGAAVISGTLTNITSVVQTITYIVTPSAGGCDGATFTVTITLNPSPVITSMNAAICSGGTFSLTPVDGVNGTVPAGTTYSWAVPAGTGFTGGASGSGSSNISGTLTNTTNIVRTATYTVIPVSSGYTGPSFTVTITINPAPAINAMAASVCTGDNFTITPVDGTNGMIPAGTTYTWAAPAGAGFTGGAAGTGALNITGNLVSTTSSASTATYTVTPSSGGCSGSAFIIAVTVNPRPAITPVSLTVCSGIAFIFTPADGANGTVPSGTTYSWAAPSGAGYTGGTAGSGAAVISGTLTNTTSTVQTATYTVTPVSGSCPGAPFTLTVTLSPKAVILPMAATICSGGTFNVIPSDGVNGTVPAVTTYTWAAPSVSGSLVGGLPSGGASANINGTLVNTSSTVQTAIYTVTAVSGSCTGSVFQITVTVNPKPAVLTIPVNVCSGLGFTVTPVNITDGIVPAGTTYSWSAPAGTGFTGGTPGSGSANISGLLTNVTNTIQTATYSVTPLSGSCAGTPFNVVVTINPAPALNSVLTSTCSDAAFTVAPVNTINGIVPAVTTYSWAAPTGAGFTGGTSGSGALNISGTLTNTTNTVQAVNYTVVPVSGSCTGNPFTITVMLNPKPVITDISTAVCSGSGFSVLPVNGANGSIPAGTVYSWTAPSGTGFTGGSSGSGAPVLGGTLFNSTNTVKTAIYTVTPISGSCTGPAFTVTLTINPKPEINLQTDIICSGGAFTVIPLNGTGGLVPAGTTYSWPAPVISGGITGGAANAGPAADITGTLSNTSGIVQTATYTVTPVSGSCTGASFPVIISVKPVPSVTADPANRTVCEYSRAVFSITASGGSGLTYQWYVNKNDGAGFLAIDPADAVYFGSNTATLTISGAARSMNGYVYHASITDCSFTDTSSDAVLSINNNPEIITQPEDSVICFNANASFTVSATGTAITYKWQMFSGAGFTDVTDGVNFAGSATNTLSIINAPATLNNKIFRAMVRGACGDPVYSNFAELKLNLAPSVTQHPSSKTICDGGGPVTFSASGSGTIDSLRWQVFASGVWTDIHDNPIYSGSSSQTLTLAGIPLSFNGYSYRLALKAKCTIVYTNTAILTVNANPVVDFSALGTINACGGVTVVLDGNPSGGSGSWSQHTWTGDVGPLDNYFIESPSFKTSMAGSYTLNYKVKDSNGCQSNDDLTVVVESPSAAFQKSIQKGCTPLPVSFTKDMTGLAKFWWDFNDGSPIDSINANPVHLFTNSNSASIEYFDVKLTVRTAGGCSDSYISSLMVYPEVDAGFNANNDTVCSDGTLNFTSAPGASKYFWDFGDGNTGYSATETTSNIFTNFTTAPITRIVKLTTTSFYNCTDEQTMNIVVMPVPQPQFLADPLTQVYSPAGNPVTFTNQTNAGTWNMKWKFGDGGVSAAQNPAHTYTGVGDYNVTLTASNASCSDSIKHIVSVKPQAPVAMFDSIQSGCSPLYMNINNTSLNTNIPGTTYFWSFGDGSTSTAKNPTYTYFDPGDYRVELTIKGPGGISTYSRVVSAYPSPIASLKVMPTYVYVNDEAVRFFNLSQGADTWVWDFGDGDTSRMKEPTHKYMEEGIFDITLWAYSANGCVDQYILSPGVTVEPAGEMRFGTVFRPNLNGPIEIDGPPEGPDVDMFFYPPIKEKVMNYKLQVFNRWGTLIWESRDINKPWNGYYKGELCQQGVYVWYVEGKYSNGSVFRKVGDITLLH